MVLDRHPDGIHIALSEGHSRGGIYRLDSGAKVAELGEVEALRWFDNGNQYLLGKGWGDRTYELHQWPSGNLTGSATHLAGLGEVIAVVISPSGCEAVGVWRDQTEAGVDFLHWSNGGLQERSELSYYGSNTLAEYPVFSSNGSHLVLCFSGTMDKLAWWSHDEEDDPYESISEGGTFICGFIIIGNVLTGKYCEPIEIETKIEPGWQPEEAVIAECAFVGAAIFLDASTFDVPLGNGEVRQFSVDGDLLP
ncbi:hypothetical protein [Armatimonas rosea]|uniref:Uncharacterized protein n=1 Tax=Armatimonas rosea TaxID=685828 RepID=A0A7W9W6Z7_ARMRO|nr:hypothetical protein [Armatimonas rosea]MBB6051108.1 hypothetical protein [Armatimonas rosea]